MDLKQITVLLALGFAGVSCWADDMPMHHHEEGMSMDDGSMSHEGHMDHMHMTGMYGSYPMTREASGTSWQPDSSHHEGLHLMKDDWAIMVHGYFQGVYDHQGGQRGDEKWLGNSMLMIMAQHPLAGGTFGFRNMLSLDPATVGKNGYPDLLQTGETANGQTPLIDRQHPHDLFMELAATYSHPLSEGQSAFAYFGYPGEPALGPVTFMHRYSGIEFPEAPIYSPLA
jgi:hypothetical protein